MHVVIAGCGRVGSEMTVSLSRQGHTVSVVDKNPHAFERLPPGFEGQTFVGIAFDRETLEVAGIRDAGAFIAVTNGDNSNIVSSRIAREHYEVPKVVARIYDPRRAEIYRRLGISTVATVQWASSEIYDVLFHGIEHVELAMGNGEMVLVRLDVPPALAGRPASALGDGKAYMLVAVDRLGSIMLPAPDVHFQEGDVAHVIVRRDALPLLREAISEVVQ